MTLGCNIAENLQLKTKKDTILKKSLYRKLCGFLNKKEVYLTSCHKLLGYLC